jgi:hypothetical protein
MQLSMQYFPVLQHPGAQACCPICKDGEIELLFYLVTRWFAKRLWHRRQEKFAVEFRGLRFDPDEQVPKYSNADIQVPYNQQLGKCGFEHGVAAQDSEMATVL